LPVVTVPSTLGTCELSGEQLVLSSTIDPAIGDYDFDWSPKTGLDDPFILSPTLNSGALEVGDYQYTLTVVDNSTGCGNIAKSTQVSIAAVPEVVCPASFSMFNAAGPVQLAAGTPAGGVYSGTGVYEDGGAYFFDPLAAGLGLTNINYTYSSVENCESSCLLQVLVLDQSVLPVEMLYFEANAIGEKVFLDWATASELNNDRFEVERSNDGIDWEYLGSVKGAGTSVVTNTYQFIDAYPVVGVNYYRLKQVDFDGKFEYSLIRSVNVETVGSNQLVRWYPNPSKGEVIIVPVRDIKWVIVTDMAGRSVLVKELSAGAEQTLSLGEIPAGTYLISFVTDKIEQTDKLIIQR
jgi:hypothetical protein